MDYESFWLLTHIETFLGVTPPDPRLLLRAITVHVTNVSEAGTLYCPECLSMKQIFNV
jgi:hypothetical protein